MKYYIKCTKDIYEEEKRWDVVIFTKDNEFVYSRDYKKTHLFNTFDEALKRLSENIYWNLDYYIVEVNEGKERNVYNITFMIDPFESVSETQYLLMRYQNLNEKQLDILISRYGLGCIANQLDWILDDIRLALKKHNEIDMKKHFHKYK